MSRSSLLVPGTAERHCRWHTGDDPRKIPRNFRDGRANRWRGVAFKSEAAAFSSALTIQVFAVSKPERGS